MLLDRVVYHYRMHPDSLTINRDEARAAKVRDEFLAIAENHLAPSELPAEAQRWCVRWQERESAQAALRALLAGDVARCAGYAQRGLRINLAWPVMFARHFAGNVFDRVFGSRPEPT